MPALALNLLSKGKQVPELGCPELHERQVSLDSVEEASLTVNSTMHASTYATIATYSYTVVI